MKHTERNYKATVKRGLITEDTSMSDFALKLSEESGELCKAVLLKRYFDIQEELADVIITAYNFAHHFGIDIDKAIEEKTIKNENR